MSKFILEIRAIKDPVREGKKKIPPKKIKEMKATSFSEALDEQARYEEKMSDKYYSHVREV